MEGIIRDVAMNNKGNGAKKDQSKSDRFARHKQRLSIDDTFADRSYSFRVNWMKDGKLLSELKKDNIDIELFQYECKGETDDQNNKTIKSRLLFFLQSNPIQIIIALLVLVDAGIVIAEIILEIHSLKNSIEAHKEQMRETREFMNRTFYFQIAHIKFDDSHDGISYMETVLGSLNENSFNCTSERKLTQSKSNKVPHLRVKRAGASMKRPTHDGDKVSEKKHKSQTLHVVSEALHYASIIILGLFVLEVGLKISCVGCKFFKAKFEVVDAVVIVTSFVADVVIVNVGSQEISVMIIFLLWRIVRVINGLLMHEKQRDEFRIALQKKARRVSEMKVEHMTIENEMQEKHILALEECSREAGVPEIVIKRCRPKYIQYTKDQTNNPLKSIAALTTGFMGGLVGAQHSNKDINRFAAAYSPCCTPRNRSPQQTKRTKTSTPSWGDLINSSTNISQESHLNPHSIKPDQGSIDNSDGEKSVSFYISRPKGDKIVSERIHSPCKDFTNHSIISPYIEDLSESASSCFSMSSVDDIEDAVLFRCSHSESDTTLLANSDGDLDSITKSVDYV